MRGSIDAVALPHPELGAVMRLTRPLVAAIVVLAAAGAGYVGSLLWPLPTISGPAVHLATTMPDVPSPSQPSAVVSLPEKAQTEVRGTSTSSPDSSVAVLHRAPAGQTEANGRIAPKTSTGVSRSERTAAARRTAASAKVSRIARGPGASGAQSNVVEFAANPRPNQSSRDFMAHPSRN
jgi:hypothetical protein